MAEFLGIQMRSYQSYEGGDRRPDYEKLVALADYFGVTTDYLLGLIDEPRPLNEEKKEGTL